jgi:hypothetical protein
MEDEMMLEDFGKLHDEVIRMGYAPTAELATKKAISIRNIIDKLENVEVSMYPEKFGGINIELESGVVNASIDISTNGGIEILYFYSFTSKSVFERASLKDAANMHKALSEIVYSGVMEKEE